MAAKKGRNKTAAMSLIAGVKDIDMPPEPSPSYFTEVPLNQGSSGPSPGGQPGEASGDGPKPPGVKLYFRPGLNTEAVTEGLLQALRHECTVVQIDLGCALQVNWETLAEPLLRHLVQDNLLSVHVPDLKVSVAKGKCKGALLHLLRQQTGSYVTLFDRKFKTQHFLNTDVIIDKIHAIGGITTQNGPTAHKIKETIKVLRNLTESDGAKSLLLESQEFRVVLVKAFKMIRKRGRDENKMKRKIDDFKKLIEDNEDGEEGSACSKRRKRKHKLPAFDETFSDESSDSDTDSECPRDSTSKEDATPLPCSTSDQKLCSMEKEVASSSMADSTASVKSDPPAEESAQPQRSPSPAPSPSLPEKGQVQKCYVCRQRFYTASKKRRTAATLHYKRMCIPCAEFNWKKRHQTNDLSGMVAVVTGGRIKIGYHIVLKLLRCGCKVIATTRFPHDAAKVFAQEEDYKTWADRLTIYPLDLKNADGIYNFITYLKRTLDKLDILINNAAQTIHRPMEFYRYLLDYEQLPTHALPEVQQHLLVGGINLNKAMTSGNEEVTKQSCSTNENGVMADEESSEKQDCDPIVELPVDDSTDQTRETDTNSLNPTNNSSLSTDLAPPTQMRVVPPMRMSSFEREALFPAGRFDSDGQQLDLRRTNTWRTVLEEVPVGELLEVMMVNTVAPFILDKELKELMVKSREPRKFIVNVSAMEGQFSRRAKTEFHPHTNMAKAALNMMTRTAALSYRVDNIFMTAVDTGWVTDERPFYMAQHEERKGFILPLDTVDGAARVLDPIIHGVTSDAEPHYAVFLKDYRPYPW